MHMESSLVLFSLKEYKITLIVLLRVYQRVALQSTIINGELISRSYIERAILMFCK